MNDEAQPAALDWSVDGEPPKAILVWPYLVFHWAVQSIMPVMRERYGTRFLIAVPNDNMADRYHAHLTDRDELIRFPNFHEAADVSVAEDEIYDLARDNEARYGVNYMRDIIQLDRRWFTKLSSMAPNSIFGEMEPPTLARMFDAINRTFVWSEELFEQHQIDLFLGWPLTFQDACCTYVAQKRDILVTYPYPAKLEDRVFWASGAFTASFQHNEAFERVTEVEPFDVESLISPAVPVKLRHDKVSDLYTTRRIARDIATLIYKDLRRIAADIRHRRKFWASRPINLRRIITTKLRTWRFFHRYCRLCESDLDALARRPFVFYAFHQEPEFTVQGQAKDYNDQMAIVRQIAKSLPAGFNVVIKEHVTLGFRNLSYYQELTAFPNVLMAHPDIPGPKLVGRSHAVASLRGTVTLEAALLGKPALVFVPGTEFSMLSNTRLVPSLAKLVECLAEIAKPVSAQMRKCYHDDGARFRTAVKEMSFSAPPLYSTDGSLLPPETAARAVDLLVRLNNLFRQRGGKPSRPRRRPSASGSPLGSAENRSGQL